MLCFYMEDFGGLWYWQYLDYPRWIFFLSSYLEIYCERDGMTKREQHSHLTMLAREFAPKRYFNLCPPYSPVSGFNIQLCEMWFKIQ